MYYPVMPSGTICPLEPLMTTDTTSEILQNVCTLLSKGQINSASSLIRERYPFAPAKKSLRQYSPRQMTSVFIKDGFIDRYRGTRLVFPPSLRLISRFLPNEFPYHKNWKMTECHSAYWELLPTIDHIHPVALGGADTVDNWISCSMLTNNLKSVWTSEQLGWELLPPGDRRVWDGLLTWFVECIEKDQTLLNETYFKRWHIAA